MSDLVFLEHYNDFQSASYRARALATRHRKETALRRSQTGWDVLVPTSLRDIFQAQESESEYEPGEDDYEYEHDDDRQLIAEEMIEDQENWARSDEDGWYYPDE
ncbi:hypothetical protein [Dokdonella sp.]|uniref:hypothetical protein n=1 Tax=Dokdonella sp. TaxID=2291710 RepID=UPI0025C62924|nr:hypothetical protein [Dokdonella sp.]MBX3691627.1 hypothetical protein [Dokdonella sp.]